MHRLRGSGRAVAVLAFLSAFALSACDLVLLKEGPEAVYLAEPFSYTITVTNNLSPVGQCTRTNVVVTDSLPQNLEFLGASTTAGSCAEAAGTVTCNLGTLVPGQTETVTIQVRALTVDPLTNTASLTASYGPDCDSLAPDFDDFTNDTDTLETVVGGRPAPALSPWALLLLPALLLPLARQRLRREARGRRGP
ncbi:MAG: hypothetical protein KatS3mg076_2772 [Candidatus Binatia bacterium]|nr:MAG: hypothetical protein KatS3mg076_2772 [Candidatus Binatia bacterium]